MLKKLAFAGLLTWTGYNGVYARFFREPLDFKDRYGAGSWVLVTGGSEGIGYEYAREFAARSFNIILVSRSLEKLTAA
jgi:17beta-estradiol 17-dehydrogenase / very-long-chain 3-oxoacyl-CoA reductase